MSKENVELVMAVQPTGIDLVEFFSEEALAAATPFAEAAFADEFEAHFFAASGVEAEGQGLDGLAAVWRDWLAPWASYRIDAEDFLDAGDEVVVLARVQGRTIRDSVLVEHSPGAVWTISDGKITAVSFYLDRRDALNAAGLSEQDAHS
jgi:ketosteroid isomerase-like protein